MPRKPSRRQRPPLSTVSRAACKRVPNQTFKLTGVTSEHAKGMKEWELVGAPADLKLSDHVGHKVEVTGMMVGMREAEKLEGEAKPTKTEQREERKEHHFKVTGLKHLSPTCP